MADLYTTAMPPRIGRYWLVASLLLVLSPHLSRLPVWLAVAALAVVIWRLWRDTREGPLPGKMVRFLLMSLGTGAILFIFGTIIGREPGTALLTVLLALKLLELRTLRDAMLATFLGYFLVAVDFFFEESLFTGFYMFAAVLALTVSLIALNHPAAAATRTPHYLKRAGGLLLQALPLMVVLFILFPRISTPLWHMPEEGSRARLGLSEEMNPGQISELADSDELVFRVEFPATLPRADQLYWRGPVLWNTDGQRWQRLSPAEQAQLPDEAVSYAALGETLDYSVMLEPQNGQWLFALDLPAILPEVNGGAYLLGDFQLLSHQRFSERVRYGMRSVAAYRTGQLHAQEHHFALRLPDTANPQARALAERWRAQTRDDSAVVTRALNHFRNDPFYYTRQPPLLGNDAVDEFLFSTRRGFCEHYASAFVTLMRSAQIPARVVTGYQGGDFNSLGRFLEVRQNRAHAWAEVWLAGEGWVRVDPTTVIPPERVTAQLDTDRFRSTAPAASVALDSPWLRSTVLKMQQGWGAINYAWSAWVIGFDAERQKALLQRWGLAKDDIGRVLLVLLAMFGLVLALIAVALLYPRLRASDPVWQLYLRFRGKLARAGVEIFAHEGPHRLHERARQALPHQAEAIAEIITLYVALRYGRAEPAQQRTFARQIARFRP